MVLMVFFFLILMPDLCPWAITAGRGDLREPAVPLAPEEWASDNCAQPRLLSTHVCSLCLKVGLCKASFPMCCRREPLC